MKVNNLLPEVYYKESRDFSYIGRLMQAVFNYMKTAADCVNVNIDNEYINSNLIDLLVDTLGFNAKHGYINKDLVTVVTAFSHILRKKGSLESVELAVRLLMNSQEIKNSSDFNFCSFNTDRSELEIQIPENLRDIVLLEDLFDYILPAGVTYRFIRFINTDSSQINTNIDDFDVGMIRSDGIIGAPEDGIGGFYTGVVATNLKDFSEITNQNM